MISSYWSFFAAGVLLVALGWWGWRSWRRQRPLTVSEIVSAVGVEIMQDILLPDGMGGEIYLEWLLLTGHGLVVLEVRHAQGAVFASDRTEEWTVINREQRYTFRNPQPALYDRVAALRLIARDVPVAGHLLFFPGADFSKGRPKDVIFPDELLARYGKPEQSELERITEAFYPHWERVCEASRADSDSSPVDGTSTLR